ncbi:MAG: SAM-dependent methyltransferase, partial [Acidaminococcaceae bacterium]|nr:SAM-dependent methyltransferase [Acidaminococcaceae bacterium]
MTNKDSKLFKRVKQDVEYAKQKATQKIQKKDIEEIGDSIHDECVELLKKALYGDGDPHRKNYVEGVFDIDEIPNGKRKSLIKYYDALLDLDGLNNSPKINNREAFKNGGKTVLSCCVYSVYLNITELLANRTSIDDMAEFYTTFLRFTKGNAKEKGIVLTPQHITELFCDIAEFYGEEKLNEKNKIIDICCGTGSFLIAALNRIKKNIYDEQITDDKKKKKFQKAQQNSLIGVEINSSMYSLAYANMRFHGDGKSNLYNCSSLLYDSFAAIDERGNTFNNEGNEVKLNTMIEGYGEIDYGFINPPYSLAPDKETKNYPAGTSAEILINKDQQELDFIASMLYYLKRGGIGVAIVPMSCAGNGDKPMRAEILKHHTLLACMTMPGNLFFDSGIGVASCIMVFKAHIPHDLEKSVFFARWQDDGFKVIPHNGRKETP